MDLLRLQKNWWRNGFELGLKQNIYIIDNFVSRDECAAAISSLGNADGIDGWQADDGNVVTSNIEPSNPFWGVIQHRLLPMASARAGRRLTLYLNPYLRKYPDGSWLGDHCDSEAENEDGPLPAASFNGDFTRCPMLIEYAANIYLNDDYDGGELVFKKLRHSIRPKAGQLIMFPSGIEYLHEVTQVSNGSRCSVVAFLTTEKLAFLHSKLSS